MEENKKEAASLPVAGCGSLNYEQVEAIAEELSADFDDGRIKGIYLAGFMGGLSFVAAPEGCEMHGSSPTEFAINGYSYTEKEAERIAADIIGEVAEVVLSKLGFPGRVRMTTIHRTQNGGE